jgi:hypothetical protein
MLFGKSIPYFPRYISMCLVANSLVEDSYTFLAHKIVCMLLQIVASEKCPTMYLHFKQKQD